MKATGQVRRIDDLGRVVVPKEVRRNLGIREGDALQCIRVAVEDSDLSCRMEFLQSITELEARLKLEEEE